MKIFRVKNESKLFLIILILSILGIGSLIYNYYIVLNIVKYQKKSNLLNQIQIDFLEARRHEKNYIIRKTPEWIKKVELSIKDADDLCKKVNIKIPELVSYYDTFIKLIRKKAKTEDFEEILVPIARNLEYKINLEKNKLEKQIDIIKKSLINNVLIIIGIFIIFSVFGLFISNKLVRKIVEYEGELKNREEEISETSMELALGLSEVFNVLQEFRKGNYDIRINEDSKIEILSQLAKTLNIIIDETGAMINELSEVALSVSENFEVLRQISLGNFTVKANEESRVEIIVSLAKVINEMIEKLKILIENIKTSSSQISSSATEVSSANTEMKSNIEMTRKRVANVTTSTAELTASIMQVAGNAKKVSEMTEKTKISIEETYKQTEQAASKMIEAQNKMKEAVSKILELKEYAKNINEIIEAITDISEKSDLLALNAAIEASGAGETGKRFRVVADEMRRLADSSLSSSKKINEILTNIHRGIEAVVEEGGYVSKSIEEAANLINMIKLVFDNITKLFLDTADKMKEVALATEQQAKTTELLSESMQEIDKAAEQNVVGIEQSVVAVNNFLALANKLNELIPKFKV